MTLPPVNIDELNEIMDNDQELIRECFYDFLADYPELMTDLKSAIESLDFKKIDDTAHKLKGALGYLAAAPAAQSAIEMETAGKNQDPEHLDQKLSALETQCHKLIDFIKKFPG